MGDDLEGVVHRRVNSQRNLKEEIPVKEYMKAGMKTHYNYNEPRFGVKAYECKDSTLKDKVYKIVTPLANPRKASKKTTYFDSYIKGESWKQAASKYNTGYDWSKNFGRRGKFLPSKKETFTESIIRQHKSNPRPGPTHYAPKKLFGVVKPRPEPSSLTEKNCAFIEEAKWKGAQTPAYKTTISYTVPDAKPRMP